MPFDPIKARDALDATPGNIPAESVPQPAPEAALGGFNPEKAAQALNAPKAPSLAPVARVVSSGPTADQEAATTQLARSMGVQPETVRRKPEEVKALSVQRQFENAPPALRAMLQDVDFARLAQDDIENLTRWSDATFSRGVQAGTVGAKMMGAGLTAVPKMGNYKDNLALSDVYSKIEAAGGSIDLEELGITNPMSMEASFAQGYMNATPVERQAMASAAVAAIARDKEALTELQTQMQAYSKEIQAITGDVPNFTDIESAKGFSDWLAFNAGQAIPYMAITALAGVTTGGVGVAASGYGMGVGDIASELVQEGEFEGGSAALTGAVPYAALEFLGPAARPFRGVAGNALEAVAEGYFRRIGKELPENIVEEFINEAGQEIIKTYTVAGVKEEEVELNTEQLLEWFNAGMAGAAGGAGMSAGSSVFIENQARRMGAIMREQARYLDQDNTAARIASLEQMAADSKLRGRDPEKFEAYLNTLDNEPSIAVPASEVDTFYQGEVADEVLEKMGIGRADYDSLIETGGSIEVKQAAFASYFANTEASALFTEHGSIGDAMSAVEARAYQEGVGETVMREVEQAAAELPAGEINDQDQIQQELTQSISAAQPRVTRTQAAAQASVASNIFASIAARTGTKVGALAQRYGLEVRGASDVPLGVVADTGAAVQPAAQTSPPTPEQIVAQEEARQSTIFEQEGIADLDIDVALDDGTTQTMKAGDVRAALEERRDKARSLLECLRYG